MYQVFGSIQKKLAQSTSSIIRNYKVSPLDYREERSMVSHLAIAADRSNFFATQEYKINSRYENRKVIDLVAIPIRFTYVTKEAA